MSFTDEKIKVLNNLLRQYEFTEAFTFYNLKDKVSDSGSSSKYSISISGDDFLIKKSLSGGGSLAIFPIVFDYFDAVLDKKMSVSNMSSFNAKTLKLQDFNQGDDVIFFLVNELFKKAVKLRNKIIHNDLIICEENGEIVLPGGQVYKIDDLSLLNRLIFNVASKCVNGKPYALYEKCAALALYKKVFGSFQSVVIDSLYQEGIIIDMVVYARNYRDFSEKTISLTESLFDIVAEDMEIKSEKNGNTEFKRCIPNNRTFKFRLGETNIVVPAELIKSNVNLTLNDISSWCM